MACYRPLSGWRGRGGAFVFRKDEAVLAQVVQVPCGQCIGCRLDRSREWAMRCMHEASLYEENCFLTLTYDEDHVPEDGGLVKWHFQDFIKRLRSRYAERRIRYFHCGEYGERLGRPHYHAIVFNFDFMDKKFFKSTDAGDIWTSDVLESLWPFGFGTVGAVSFESAAYVARYVLKKVTGERGAEHYWKVNPVTGELAWVEPEYCTMSRRPGIGKGWFDLFSGETYRDDTVVMRGEVMKPPRYYDKLFDVSSEDELRLIKRRRVQAARRHAENNTPDRLAVREKVKMAQVEFLKREVE